MFAWVSVDRFRLFHWQYCPAPVSTDLCLCVCVSGSAHSWMHSCIASWQNVGHGGTAAAWHTLTWEWPEPHSLQYHSACFHLLPISLPPLFSAIFILCLSHWLFMCFLNILSPHFLCQFNFTHLCHTCILYTCSRVFSDFPVCYSLWHLCHLSSVLSFTSFGGKSL